MAGEAETKSITETIKGISQSVTIDHIDGYNNWISLHGYEETEETHKIVRKQFTLSIPLRIYELTHVANVAMEHISLDSYYDAITIAHKIHPQVTDPCFLDKCIQELNEEHFIELIEISEKFTNLTKPSFFFSSLYNELVAKSHRDHLGQYHTPRYIGKLSANLLDIDTPRKVFSAGTGTGNLIEAIIKHFKNISPEDVSGVDISPLAVLLTSVSILSDPQNISHESANINSNNIFNIDQTELVDIDTIISNPPYTKHHKIGQETKTRIKRKLDEETSVVFSRQSPLYIYITAHLMNIASPGTTALFITPSEFLNTKYGTAWKEYMINNHSIDMCVLFNQSNNSEFENAMTTTLITKITAREQQKDDIPFIRIDDSRPATRIATEILMNDKQKNKKSWGTIQLINKQNLDPEENWSSFFYEPVGNLQNKYMIPLNELFEVKRGIATGNNDFFCLSEEERKGKNQGWTIDKQFVERVIRNAESVPHYKYTQEDWVQQKENGNPVWLLYNLSNLPWDGKDQGDSLNLQVELSDFFSQRQQQQTKNKKANQSSEANTEINPHSLTPEQRQVITYLKHGMQLETPVNDSYLASQRSPWYQLNRREPADILYTSFSRDIGRFIKNELGAYNLNNLHGLYTTYNFTEKELHAILAYLNSRYVHRLLTHQGRELSSGVLKVEPGDLSSIPIIDPRKLSQEKITELSELFEKLCGASRTNTKSLIQVQQQIMNAIHPLLS